MHATIHRRQFSRSCEGFTNGMNTFFPDSSSFLSESGHLFGYLESVVQFPHEQCLVPTISYHKNEEKAIFLREIGRRAYKTFKPDAMFV